MSAGGFVIKNVVFDFGGVVVDLDKGAAVEGMEGLGFVSAGSYVDNSRQAGFFAALERGDIGPVEFAGRVRKEGGIVADDALIFSAWNRMLAGIPERRLQRIAALRGEVRTFMLSNTNVIHWDYACDVLLRDGGLRMEDCFERIFLSYEMHLRKPEAEIFRKMLDLSGLSAGETLFIDDSAENCAAARCLGLHVFRSVRPDDWVVFLDEMEGVAWRC